MPKERVVLVAILIALAIGALVKYGWRGGWREVPVEEVSSAEDAGES